jgi:Zn-dependent protease with chaperone function
VVQVILLSAFVSMVLRDQLGAWLATDHAGIGPWAALLLGVGPFVVIGGAALAIGRVASRSLERTGAWRTIVVFDRLMLATRWAALAATLSNVLVLDALGRLREALGGFWFLGELIVLAPLMGVLVLTWVAAYPIERTLREAALMRNLDEGRPVYPPPTRGRYVLMQIRHQALIVLVPMFLALAWSDAGRPLLAAFGLLEAHAWWQALGVAIVVLGTPLLIRRLWHTESLPEGEVRRDLDAMIAAHRVRARDLLLWRTDGTLVNAAVLGAVRWARYILITDALLDSLPRDQVRAVMAHEIAHVKLRHLPWLGVSTLAALLWTLVAIDGAARVAIALAPAAEAALAPDGAALAGVSTLVSAVVALAVFGAVSRRMEWQADAFAVRTLSVDALDPEPTAEPTADVASDALPSPPPRVTSRAINAMAGALHSVARLNHIPLRKPSWRHGSIARRLDNLHALGGRPLGALPIDATVSAIKIASLVLLVSGVGVSLALGMWS